MNTTIEIPPLIVRLTFSFLCLFLIFFLARRQKKQQVHRLFLSLNICLFAYSFPLSFWRLLLAIFHFDPNQLWFDIVIALSNILSVAAIGFAGVYWFLFAAAYSGNRKWLQGWRRTILYVPTFVIMIPLIMSIFSPIWTDADEIIQYLRFFDQFLLVKSTIFIVWAFILYFRFVLDIKEEIYKKQAVIFTVGGFLPILGGIPNFFYTFQPFARVKDILLILHLSQQSSFIAAILLFSYALFKIDFLDILPIALREIFHNMHDAVLVLDTDLRLVQSNSATARIFPEIHPGASLKDYLPTIHTKIEENNLDSANKLEFEISLNDQIYWVRSIPLLIKDHPTGTILILTDITKRKRAEEQLAHDALHDRLTDLPNRTLLIDRLSQAIKRAKREKDFKYAILFLDLDRFKRINDSLGHQAGDELLIQVSHRITQSIRAVDTVARFGGDEFVVLLEDIEGLRAATDIALRIQESLSIPLQLNGHQVFTSSSIGIALGGPRYQNPDDLLRDADIAMYQAKENGRSGYALFDQEMHTRISSILELETDLRKAVLKGEFDLHYQPVVSLEHHQILGFEAFLRWHHPKKGLLYPADFLHEAEETDLIIPIGHWTIHQACQDLASWQAEYGKVPPLSMSVNLSRKQLLDKDLLEEVRKAINENNLQPGNLAFEITENVLAQENMPVLNTLLRLKSLGISVYVDAFGTGYASLYVLPSYPIDALKIDRSFIRRITQNTDDYAIVQAIVNLASNLNKDVIAEGIESMEKLEKVLSLGCHVGQGSFLYKPLPSHAIQSLLKREILNA